MGIHYPRKDLENLDKVRGKNVNKSSINSAVLCGLYGSGTIYRLVVGRSEQGYGNLSYMQRGIILSEVTTIFLRYILVQGPR